MNRDAVRLDNLSLDALEPKELARYRNGAWCRGTKVPESKPEKRGGGRRTYHPSLVDSAPYVLIVRALVARDFTPTQLGLYCDVGAATIRDLAHGKTRVQHRTALKLQRLTSLLPSETA